VKGKYKQQQDNSYDIKNIGSGSKKFTVCQQDKNSQHNTNAKIQELSAIIS
jgi:hypothetical protein